MLELIEIIGMKRSGNAERKRKYCTVKCSYCESVVEMRYDTFMRSKSCGCLRAVKASKTALSLRTHKMSNTRLYQIWQSMKDRCYNPNNKRYNRYGGRGIAVCDEWRKDFIKFYDWATENGYSSDLTIDRVDNDRDYSHSNCRWTTSTVQSRNRSSNIKVQYNGKVVTLVELSESTKIPYSVLSARYEREGDTEMLTRPVNASTGRKRGENNNNAKITDDIAKNIKHKLDLGVPAIEIADHFNINKHIVYDIKRGKTWKHV